MKFLKDLVWITQLGFSIVIPLVLFTQGAVWLRDRYDLGVWIVLLGLGLGLYSAFSAARAFARIYLPKKDPKKEDEPPISFHEHD